MKVLIFNGSPRKGNTNFAIDIFVESMKKNMNQVEIDILEPNNMNIKACQACYACQSNGGNCVFDSTGEDMCNKILASDIIVFATPIYFFGITAQLKVALDKFYQLLFRDKELLKGKKIGLIKVAAAPIDFIQYDLVSKQFEAICDLFEWEKSFDYSISAKEISDTANNTNLTDEIRELHKSIL